MDILKLKNLFSPGAASLRKEELLSEFKTHYLQERNFVRNAIYWMVRSNEVDDLVQETFKSVARIPNI